MTAAEFTFIEYSFCPMTYDLLEMEHNLTSLGFVNRIAHVNNTVTLWSQDNTIILLRETNKVKHPGITGIGLSVDPDVINDLDLEYDGDLNLHYTMDGNGMRILLLLNSYHDISGTPFGENYRVIDTTPSTGNNIKNFSGILMGSTNRHQMDFYQSIGFKFVKSDDRFNTLICTNNRFSIVFDKEACDSTPIGLITDTDDIFTAQTKFVINGLDILNFNETVEGFGNYTHRVNGYNCFAYGNETSYSIESIISHPLPHTDIVVRFKKQYLGIKRKALERYYDKQ